MEELVLVAEDLLTQSVRTKNMNGMHRAADAFGVYFVQKGYFNQAFKILYRSMRYYERTENQAYLMKAYGYLGGLYMAWGNEQEAISYFEKMMTKSKNHTQENVHFTAINNLTLAYFQNSRYDLGIEILKRNEPHLTQMNLENKSVYFNLYGNYFLQKSEIDSAKLYYEKSLKASELYSSNRLISTAYANLAICEFGKNPEKSLQLFEESYQYAVKSTSIERISVSLFNIASWHLEFEDRKKALNYYQQSYEVAASANSYVNMYDALDEIAEIYRSQDNWILVDSINQIIQDIKSEQHGEFIDLSNDEALLENAFAQNTPFLEDQAQSESDKALFRTTLIISLLVLLLIQFLVILYLSYRLARKH
jgi:tetratricopeptide (TPR) repeat protein